MTNEQNNAFMNDPRRIEAQKRLDKVIRHIQADVNTDGSAMYYLTVLPVLMKELSDAYENLSIVEAAIEAEITEKVRFHGFTAS